MIINLCGGSGGGSSAPIKLQGLIARENGTYTPDEGYDGYSEVLVDVTEPVEVFVVPNGMKFAKSKFSEIPNGLNFSECTDCSEMFLDCTNLINLEINSANATTMNSMCYGCVSLTTAELDSKNVTSMISLFASCGKLTDVNFNDTSKVTNMERMFASCGSLKKSPELDTTNVLNMSNMYIYCTSLETFPKLNTENCRNLNYLFGRCTSLVSIPELDYGSATGTTLTLFGNTYASKLTDLGGFLKLKPSITSYSFEYMLKLTVESLMNVINGLFDWSDYPDGKAPLNDGTIYSFGTTHSIKFGQTNLDKLTPEQIAVATAKGWTLTA